MINRPFVLAALHAVTAFIVIKLAALFKVSFIIGTYTGFFSGTSIALPLLGSCLGMMGISAAVLTSLMGQGITMGIPSAHYLAYYIPGLFSSACWAHPSNSIIRLWVPLTCMVLFVIHPVGMGAFPYALYWLIPIALYLKQSSSLFAQALSSTFIAHAVGSVIWLYALPMSSAAWLALIPIVAVERLCFAVGMVVVYQGVRLSVPVIQKIKAACSDHVRAWL